MPSKSALCSMRQFCEELLIIVKNVVLMVVCMRACVRACVRVRECVCICIYVCACGYAFAVCVWYSSKKPCLIGMPVHFQELQVCFLTGALNEYAHNVMCMHMYVVWSARALIRVARTTLLPCT